MWQTVEKVKSFDAYPQAVEDFSKRSNLGGIVTILTLLITVALASSEFMSYFTPQVTETLSVFKISNLKLQFAIELDFPKISCDFLSIDASSLAGDVEGTDKIVTRTRLDLQGNVIGPSEKEKKTDLAKTCGDCYGASTGCCNTCQDVKDAYENQGWEIAHDLGSIVQCIEEEYKFATAFKEGCRLRGELKMSPEGGNIHIIPGFVSQLGLGDHTHSVLPLSFDQFNMTHIIRELTFSVRKDRRDNPLEGTVSKAERGNTMFQYFMKLVPLERESVDGKRLHWIKYSATRHVKSNDMRENAVSAVFIEYELSSMMLVLKETQKPLGVCFRNVCAIIGGIYIVMSILYGLFNRTVRITRRVK